MDDKYDIPEVENISEAPQVENNNIFGQIPIDEGGHINNEQTFVQEAIPPKQTQDDGYVTEPGGLLSFMTIKSYKVPTSVNNLGFQWGAFLINFTVFGWVWALISKQWWIALGIFFMPWIIGILTGLSGGLLGILSLVPIALNIYLGFKGAEIYAANMKWNNLKEIKEYDKKYIWASIIIWAVIGIMIVVMFSALFIPIFASVMPALAK